MNRRRSQWDHQDHLGVGQHLSNGLGYFLPTRVGDSGIRVGW